MRLFNSYVRHYDIFGHGKRWIEGYDNDIRGSIRKGRFRLRLTNSHGNPTTIVGRAFRFCFIRFMCGTAYGYVNKPEGLRYFGMSLALHRYEIVILPTKWHMVLFVRLEKAK